MDCATHRWVKWNQMSFKESFTINLGVLVSNIDSFSEVDISFDYKITYTGTQSSFHN